ncbi:hypothetical protein N9933_01070 [bacterium]|nr:hypothetical protein [bacterium]
MLYGKTPVSSSDTSLQSQAFPKFGLNINVRCTKFEYNPTASADGSPNDALDIFFTVEGKEQRVGYWGHLYEITKAFVKGESMPLEMSVSDQAMANGKKDILQVEVMVLHILEALGVSEETFNRAMATPMSSYADWCKVVSSLVPSNFNQVPLDILLEYEAKPRKDNTRTWPSVPQNLRDGIWVCPHQTDGPYLEKLEPETSLTYVNAQGKVHPLQRGPYFVKSNRAKEYFSTQVEVVDVVSMTTTVNPVKWGVPTEGPSIPEKAIAQPNDNTSLAEEFGTQQNSPNK